jgi:hypothetical protein
MAQLLIRPDRVLKGKLSAPAVFAASLVLRAARSARHFVAGLREIDVREVSRFEERHDELWARAARDLRCTVVRDASYLNWKYVDQPGQQFVRVEVMDAGRVAGVVVLMIVPPTSTYQYTRAFIVDLVTPLSDTRLLKRLLHVAVRAGAARGADAVICLHINPRLTGALRRGGFQMRPPTRYFLASPGPFEGDAREQLLKPEHWFITHGDSDIDRPW